MQVSAPSRPHWPTIVQFFFSLFAMLGCLGIAVVLIATTVITSLNGAMVETVRTATMLRASGLGLAGVLLAISTYFSFLRILGRPAGRWVNAPIWRRLPWALLPVWPLALLAGDWVARNTHLSWLLLPPLYLLGVGLPIWWLVAVGRRGLSVGSPQRAWGIFTVGLVYGPGLILIIELAGILVLGVAAAAVLAVNPDWQVEVTRLSQRLLNSQGDLEAMQRILRPWLLQPGLLFVGLASISGLVPLVEETFKPIGLYFLAGRRLTAAEGFVGGLISGAGFTLFESLNMSSSLAADTWAAGTLARAGTDLVHILATGLMGWALASAWTERRYLRLGATFLLSVFLHGFWNAISVVSGILPLVPDIAPGLPGWLGDATLAPIALGVLVVAMFAILARSNRILRRAAAPAPLEIAPEAGPGEAR